MKPKQEDEIADSSFLEMSDDDMLEWIDTTRRVIFVLKQENKEKYEEIYTDFLKDLMALRDMGRVSEDDYDEILEGL